MNCQLFGQWPISMEGLNIPLDTLSSIIEDIRLNN